MKYHQFYWLFLPSCTEFGFRPTMCLNSPDPTNLRPILSRFFQPNSEKEYSFLRIALTARAIAYEGFEDFKFLNLCVLLLKSLPPPPESVDQRFYV